MLTNWLSCRNCLLVCTGPTCDAGVSGARDRSARAHSLRARQHPCIRTVSVRYRAHLVGLCITSRGWACCGLPLELAPLSLFLVPGCCGSFVFFAHEAGPCCCSRITGFLPVAHVILGWGMHEGFFSPCLCPFCWSILLFLEDASISWLTGRWLCLRGIHPDELGWSRILKVDRAERW